MSAKKSDTPVSGDVVEPVAKKADLASPAPDRTPVATVKTVKRERKELVAVVGVAASGVTISVAVEVDDNPTLAELQVKGAQADAKTKAVLKKVASVAPKGTALSPKAARFDLLEKKVVIEVGAEPPLNDETQESVRKAMK
jgi:hypothetical protein